MEKVASTVVPALIEAEMKQSYLDYAMSVIIGRALPDVRDGLKPVHRRILFAMNEMGLHHNKPYRKSARIVGDTLGKYHPHGDSAVYDALVRMAQSFSLRYPLVDGQGNFGSVDGDSAAAMRYTEARMAKITQEMLADIDKDTVDFMDNFDGSMQEPTVLPSRIPNLLINGSTGIAVGMATSIPPHNLREVCDSVIKLINDPEIPLRELVEGLPGPDFPTGGMIVGRNGIRTAYGTGHGKIKVRAKSEVVEGKNKQSIIASEIPYMVNKSMLIQEIADCAKSGTVEGLSDLRDESDKAGLRIVIELKKSASPEVVLNQLYKHTRLQTTFSMNLLALVKNKPKVMDIKELISNFVKHRQRVIIRRTRFELKKAEERAHILEGLLVALKDIDKAISLIRASKDAELARQRLMGRFSLTEVQAQAILDMKLQRLTSLEQDKIKEEHALLLERIKDLRAILDSDTKVKELIIADLEEISERYPGERKTEILEQDEEDIEIEDLIEEEDVVVTITHSGYIKRTPLALYKQQRRGGKGIIATTTREEDLVEQIFIASTHDYILFFTSSGTVHWLKVYQIPSSSRYSSGKAIVNLLQLKKDSRITTYIKIKDFDDKHYLIMGTKRGYVKKTNLMAFSRPRAGGIRAISLPDEDCLINVLLTDGENQLIMATKNGLAVRFKEKEIRPMGRAARGVIGVRLKKGDDAVAMVKAEEGESLLTVTENGYGKRTAVSEYRLTSRGARGVRNIICSERNGKVVSVKSVTDEDEVLLISATGIIIRTSTKGISVIGRNTQGVRLMRLGPEDKIVGTAKVTSS